MDPFEAYIERVNPVLGCFLVQSGRDVRLARAEGATMTSDDGRTYDDWMAGFGSLNLGHNPRPVIEAVQEQLASGAPNLLVENLNPQAGALAAELAAAAGPSFETCFFSNSGSEAVEAAVKTAIKATGRPKVAYAAGGYHGTTLGALACMGRGTYREGFEEVVPAFAEVPFDDVEALERALAGRDVAAYLVEPVQVEAGVRVPGEGYLAASRELCDRHGALLVLDEVQTGMGRTGSLFAFQKLGADPDILVLAKSLGGGVVPVGATVMARGVWERAWGTFAACEAHNSTFGGNALACAAARKALALLGDPGLLARVEETAERLESALRRELAGLAAVRRISFFGLLGGIQLADSDHPGLSWEALGLAEFRGRPTAGPLLVERLFRRNILAQVCGHDWSVLRVEPPLTVGWDACERFIAAVVEAARWLDGY